jgi:hypothetical protein
MSVRMFGEVNLFDQAHPALSSAAYTFAATLTSWMLQISSLDGGFPQPSGRNACRVGRMCQPLAHPHWIETSAPNPIGFNSSADKGKPMDPTKAFIASTRRREFTRNASTLALAASPLGQAMAIDADEGVTFAAGPQPLVS